jgi:C-terminal processing protease CtpA/Prc
VLTVRARGVFFERTLQPNKTRPRFRGPVAVLTGPGAVSSCASFLLMMKQVPGCKLFGLPSAGASGNPHPVELANGVTVFLSRWQDLRPDGTCFEGEGIAPDVTIKSEPKDFLTADPVLSAALDHLRGNKTTR